MERTYQVIATVIRERDGYRCADQVPTFYVEAMDAAHARRIAVATMNPFGVWETHGTVYHDALADYLAW